MTMRLSEGCGTWYPENTTSGSRCSCLGGRARERGRRRVSDGVPSIAREGGAEGQRRRSIARRIRGRWIERASDRAGVRPRAAAASATRGRGRVRGRRTATKRAKRRRRDAKDDRSICAHSDSVAEGVVLLLHDERPRVRHLRVARERELPNAVGEDELLRARRLVHGRGACDARARVQLFLVGRAGCGTSKMMTAQPSTLKKCSSVS